MTCHWQFEESALWTGQNFRAWRVALSGISAIGADGEFEVGRLPEGVIRARIVDSQGARMTWSRSLVGDDVYVDIKDTYSQMTIGGRVATTDGSETGAVTVVAVGQDGMSGFVRTCEANDDGTFELRGLQKGRYIVRLRPAKGGRADVAWRAARAVEAFAGDAGVNLVAPVVDGVVAVQVVGRPDLLAEICCVARDRHGRIFSEDLRGRDRCEVRVPQGEEVVVKLMSPRGAALNMTVLSRAERKGVRAGDSVVFELR
jgi:hypothetical protein